jgi:hypothetical protein
MIYLPATKYKGDTSSILLVLLTTTITYLLTLAPGLTWSHWGADGGDLIVATVKGSLPHPPGFPFYMVLAHLITVKPYVSVASRMNLFSAIMAAGAVFFSAMTLRKQELTIWSRISASLTLGFAPLFWSQALITEVYTCAAFFISLSLYLKAYETNRRTSIFSGVAWGLALAIHPTAASGVFSIWFGRKRIWDGIIIGVLLAGFFYVSLVFWDNGMQRWADFGTVKGWLEYVSGRLYWNYAFNLPLENIPRRIVSWITLYAQQFTPIGAVLVIVGILQMYRKSWKIAAGFLLTVSLITLYAINYNSIDSFVYLIPILPLFVPFLGLGMDWLIKLGVPGYTLLLIPTILLGGHWQTISLQNDNTVDMWIERTVNQTPINAVLLTNQDDHTFALWYAQEVNGLLEDVIVIDNRLWVYPPYQRFISDKIGTSHSTFETLGETRTICMVGDKGVVCR